MTKETILTDDIMCELWDKINSSYGRELFGCSHHDFARAIEQAVLKSEHVQGLRKDADRWRAWRKASVSGDERFFIAFVKHDTGIDVANEDDLDASVDAAMEQQA